MNSTHTHTHIHTHTYRFANNAIAQSTFQDLGNGHLKSIDIRGSPTYGIFQSNSGTKNYFAGNTGIGISEPQHSLEISGSIFLNKGGRLLVGFESNDEKMNTRAAVLSSENVQTHEVVFSGNVRLDESGYAVIQCCDSVDLAVEDAVYTLTAIGSSAPNLYVSRELSKNNRTFEISRGDSSTKGLKVSWVVRIAVLTSQSKK